MIRTAPDPWFGRFTAFRHWIDAIVVPAIPRIKTRSAPVEGRVTLLGAGPGSADLITLRGLRARLEAICAGHANLNPAILLIRWPMAVHKADTALAHQATRAAPNQSAFRKV